MTTDFALEICNRGRPESETDILTAPSASTTSLIILRRRTTSSSVAMFRHAFSPFLHTISTRGRPLSSLTRTVTRPSSLILAASMPSSSNVFKVEFAFVRIRSMPRSSRKIIPGFVLGRNVHLSTPQGYTKHPRSLTSCDQVRLHLSIGGRHLTCGQQPTRSFTQHHSRFSADQSSRVRQSYPGSSDWSS